MSGVCPRGSTEGPLDTHAPSETGAAGQRWDALCGYDTSLLADAADVFAEVRIR